MTKPKLLVIGHGRHGKDTVCEMLRDHYGYTFESSFPKTPKPHLSEL
jgi:hypothetical protein